MKADCTFEVYRAFSALKSNKQLRDPGDCFIKKNSLKS